MTGSAFKPWGEIEAEKRSAIKGMDSLLAVGDVDGRHAVRCKACFSLLHWSGYDSRIRVPYGTLIDEPTLKPMAHIYVGSKASWYEIQDDLPQHVNPRGQGRPRWPDDGPEQSRMPEDSVWTN